MYTWVTRQNLDLAFVHSPGFDGVRVRVRVWIMVMVRVREAINIPGFDSPSLDK